jgi:carboxymethylenebutenolidase
LTSGEDRPTAATGIDGDTHLAVPQSGRGQAVLVLHPWWGLNRFVRDLCDRFAAEGFVALALDLYEGETTSDIARAAELSSSLDFERTGRRVMDALARLLEHPATIGPAAAVGLSMGASWAFWLSAERADDIAAVVAFYGTDEVPFEHTRARFLGHYAEVDEYEPLEGVRELEARIRGAGRDVTFHVYPGAKHWFFESDVTDAFDPAAAEIAWTRTVEFLRAALPGGEPTGR